MQYQPPFTLNSQILDLVANIAQKVGQVDAYGQLNRSPRLRKKNRIRTIHSSLAIEENMLSLEQVTAVVEGKHVIAPPKDLLEVQNAIKVYEEIDSFDPTSLDDLLRAHKELMGGLVQEPGKLRSGNVGVFAGDKLIHAGTPAKYLPSVMADLFAWLAAGDVHPLVASCVFHYEFEFIHPFQDGNGRMGRLWQTLILSRWNSLFAWLPVETLVNECQDEYYDALTSSDEQGDSTRFVEFMLGMISHALDDVLASDSVVGISDGINVGIKNDAAAMHERLLLLVHENPSITVKQMASELGISTRQAERIVSSLKRDGKLIRIGANRNGRWEVR
ncbi:Fic family protein [Collinsella sp. AGMB00827]|uniref:Fic family protein n=1 Tax=Collinsella ureilytica TaxID=2869515 RepID=A0ABS7MLQ1_9ACTN|nr:Fic family protein [Collinsella urealyticum]MBY4798227.1 Fic family protein [Collinsella urealyticum]